MAFELTEWPALDSESAALLFFGFIKSMTCARRGEGLFPGRAQPVTRRPRILEGLQFTHRMASDFDPQESIQRVGSQPQETKPWKYRKVALVLRSCSNCGGRAP